MHSPLNWTMRNCYDVIVSLVYRGFLPKSETHPCLGKGHLVLLEANESYVFDLTQFASIMPLYPGKNYGFQ
jgi:hypothetical protein